MGDLSVFHDYYNINFVHIKSLGLNISVHLTWPTAKQTRIRSI